MGFSLQLSPVSNMMLFEEEESNFRSFLSTNNIEFVEEFEESNFSGPFFEYNLSVEDDTEDWYVAHIEVGWSWWSITQKYVVFLLGEQGARNALSIHAWHGVALPAQIEPQLLGAPVLRQPRRPQVLSIPFDLGETDQDAEIARQIDLMIEAYAGDYENLYMVSGPRLLAEFNEAIVKANLTGKDALALYESLDDQNAEQIAQCNLLIARDFLGHGLKHNHLVWWCK